MSPYAFRPVAPADLPLLRRWREQPHVVEWWGPPDVEPAEETLADPRVAMWIVAHAAPGAPPRPFAYAQDYSPHDWADHPFAHLPAGARGIDRYIGERDMVGRAPGRVDPSSTKAGRLSRRRAPETRPPTSPSSAPPREQEQLSYIILFMFYTRG
jgi:hypothetical protein